MKVFQNVFLILILLSVPVFFYDPLTSYFSQDDFFHFSLVWQNSISSLPSILIPGAQGTQFYRPITREIYNLLMYKTFGLWAVPYHLFNLLMIIINGAIFALLLKRFTSNKFVFIFSGLLYLFSAVHSIHLYYLSSVQTLISTFFILIALLLYINYLSAKKILYYSLSLLFYGLALLSHESSAVLPGFLFLYEILNLKSKSIQNYKAAILRLLPFLIILSLRFIITLTTKSLPAETPYQPSFSIGAVINTFSWFTLWNFGLPEILTDFATLSLKFNPNLFKFYGYYTQTVFPLFGLILASILLILISMIKSNLADKRIWFLGICYVISLTPFLLFPNHKFVYYLTLPVLFFSSFCGILLSKYWPLGNSHKFLIVMFVIAYIAISRQTVDLNKITYWAAKRAASAKFMVSEIKKEFKNPQKGSIFYIKNDPNYPFIAKDWGTSSKQAFFILSGPDAFRLIFQDPDIKTFYQDINDLPANIDLKKLKVYEAVFPY